MWVFSGGRHPRVVGYVLRVVQNWALSAPAVRGRRRGGFGNHEVQTGREVLFVPRDRSEKEPWARGHVFKDFSQSHSECGKTCSKAVDR